MEPTESDCVSGSSREVTSPGGMYAEHQYDLLLLRISLGFIYFFFGFLKFFRDLSPAELLASQTIMKLSGYQMGAELSLQALAVIECLIGLGFLLNVGLRWVSIIFFVHMFGTFLPLVFLPEWTFKYVPFAPTMEGQYILKNLVFLAAGWAILGPVIRSPRPRRTAVLPEKK